MVLNVSVTLIEYVSSLNYLFIFMFQMHLIVNYYLNINK